MKIRISKINDSAFNVRETLNKEPLEELKESFREDGQWDPILVRPSGETFELIAGHRRVQAAKELGWMEIEATVKDINDTEALFLALKTNLIREAMSDREQGKILHQITQEYNISGSELARRIGKGREWVNRRIRISLDLHDDVAVALDTGKITAGAAEIIAVLARNVQPDFLKYIITNGITGADEIRKAKKCFLNNTIYTIG